MILRKDRDGGAAAIEFALVALILITMMVGTFEGGRFWYLQSNLAAAARDGAREMAVKNDSTAALAQFDAVWNPIGSGTLSVSVSPGTKGCAPGGQARVVATYATGSITGLIPALNTVTLTGEGVMRCGG